MFDIFISHICFPCGTVVKNLPAHAGDTSDTGSMPGLGRSHGIEMATHSSILAWKTPQTEELGRLQSMRQQRDGDDSATDHVIFSQGTENDQNIYITNPSLKHMYYMSLCTRQARYTSCLQGAYSFQGRQKLNYLLFKM